MADLIDMPKLSDTMSVGTLIKWLKKEGDAVQAGDMLAEIETDKATMELETFFTGTLIKIYAEAGSQIAIGAPLCAIGKPGEAAPVVTAPAPVAAPVPVPAPTLATVPSAASQTSADRLKISPLARKIAADQKIDATHLTGSGPGGRIVKADILAAAANPLPAVAPKSVALLRTGPIQAERTVPATNMRATIAKRLLEAKTQIPHFYLEIEVDADPLLTVRAQLNTALATEGVKLSVNDFILKASAEALRRVPGVNASWTGSGIHYHGAAHVSFAVAIEDGLITPVIRDAHLKSVFAISTEVKPLGQRAKQKKLKPEEFTGGTFCVSNLGMLGIPKFSAIINPPNAAILAVGTTVTKPVVKNGTIVVGQTMTLTLSCDHRVVDGALGAQFLAALKDLLEKPALLLV
ncbi:MAG: 2-oxo acid dehydrogenase subunit E2 [Lacunisphaera sp.]|nr:2-oxo acid dehydrogenase subunit E2 [Lacunisphaera sp.]